MSRPACAGRVPPGGSDLFSGRAAVEFVPRGQRRTSETPSSHSVARFTLLLRADQVSSPPNVVCTRAYRPAMRGTCICRSPASAWEFVNVKELQTRRLKTVFNDMNKPLQELKTQVMVSFRFLAQAFAIQ